MNKYEFLSQLRAALSTLPREERDAAMSYYEEFFSDAGEDNEQAVIASLGTPQELAKSIISENTKDPPNTEQGGTQTQYSGFTPPPTNAQQSPRWTGGQLALVIIFAVLSSPIWLGLLAGIFGIIVGLFGVIIGLVGGFATSAVALFVAGIVAFFKEPVVGLFLTGLGLIFGGLLPLAIYPLCKGIFKLIAACVKGIGSLFNKLTGRRANV